MDSYREVLCLSVVRRASQIPPQTPSHVRMTALFAVFTLTLEFSFFLDVGHNVVDIALVAVGLLELPAQILDAGLGLFVFARSFVVCKSFLDDLPRGFRAGVVLSSDWFLQSSLAWISFSAVCRDIGFCRHTADSISCPVNVTFHAISDRCTICPS
jgi:hypothetical protein